MLVLLHSSILVKFGGGNEGGRVGEGRRIQRYSHVHYVRTAYMSKLFWTLKNMHTHKNEIETVNPH
jgi:hypothetical protein